MKNLGQRQMNKKLYMWIFAFVMIGFVVSSHFVLRNIFSLLSIKYSLIYPFLSLLLIPTAWIVHKFADERMIFAFAMNYAYFIFFMFTAYFFTWPFGKLVPVIVGIALMIFSVFYSSRSYIKEIEIQGSEDIKKDVKIAHISDLHISSIAPGWKVRKIKEMIKKADPDIVIVTGDIIDRPTPKRKYLRMLKSEIPTYYTLGNHDLYFDRKEAISIIEESGFEHVGKEPISIMGLNIYGIDDDEAEITREEIEKIEPKGFSILLHHRPENVRLAGAKGFRMMLSGHTHAGQIFPIHALVMLLYRYWKGHKMIRQMLLNINPGVALFGSHWRLLSRNELTLIKVKSQKTQEA